MSPHLFVFCIINGLILTAGFRSRFNFISTRISFSPLSCNPDVSTSTEDVDTAVVLEVDAYLGPTSDFDDMEAGCSIGDLGT